MKVINIFVLKLTCIILVSSYILGCTSANSGKEEQSKSNEINKPPRIRRSSSVKKDASNQRLLDSITIPSKFEKVDESFFIGMGWKTSTTTPQPAVPGGLKNRKIKPIIIKADQEERYMVIQLIREVAQAKYNLMIDTYGRFNLTESNIQKYRKLSKELSLEPI